MAKQILGKVLPIPRGEYNSSTQYAILDIVTYNGSSYVAKTNVMGQAPTNSTYWQLLASQGEKPVYKVDYLTDSEMQEIVNEIIADSTNEFNQNVDAKTTTFNNNASSKTSDFNTNATNKTTAFNSNASSKTTSFNENASSKQSDFNTNASSATDTFDRNATAKTTAYDNNASTKIGAYNDNHTSKLGVYNDNASSKVTDFNTNAGTKTTNFNTNASDKTTAFNENYQDKLDDFNDNASSYDARITANSDRIHHLENTALDEATATGSNINITDSAWADIESIVEDGVCKQTTTIGKNLVLVDNFVKGNIASDTGIYADEGVASMTISNQTVTFETTKTYRGIVSDWIEIKENQDYTVSYVENINQNDYFTIYYFYDANKNYIRRIGNQTVTSPVDTKYVRLLIGLRNVGNGSLSNIQLEQGSSATPYEIYTGGEPSPSPDYEQPISTITGSHKIIACGKNIFDLKTFLTERNVQFTENSDGSLTFALAQSLYSNPYIFSDNDTYVSISGEIVNNSATNSRIVLLDSNDTVINSLYAGDTKKENILAKKIRFDWSSSGNITIKNLQLEKGSTATPYEPYQAVENTITLPTGQFLGKINDTYKDQVRIAFNENDGEYHAYLDKKIGKVVLDGSEYWQSYTDLGTNAKALFTKDNIAIRSPGYCSHFKVITTQTGNTDETGIMFTPVSVSLILLKIPKTELATQDINGIKAWLGAHNTEAYYGLATPTTIDLGVVNMPNTYYPVTNIFTDSELQPNLTVDYYRDPKLTIQNLQNSLTSLDARVTALENQ